MATRFDAPICPDGAHDWGPVEVSRFAGNPHRACRTCRTVTVDLDDDDWADDDDNPGIAVTIDPTQS